MNMNKENEKEQSYMALKILALLFLIVLYTEPMSSYQPGQLPETNIPMVILWGIVIYWGGPFVRRLWTFIQVLARPDEEPAPDTAAIDRSTPPSRPVQRPVRQNELPVRIAPVAAQGGPGRAGVQVAENGAPNVPAPTTAQPARPAEVVETSRRPSPPPVVVPPLDEIDDADDTDDDRAWFRERIMSGTPEFSLTADGHLLVVGGSGSGKTTAIVRLVEEEIARGSIVVAIDPHYQPGKWPRGTEIAGAARSVSGPEMSEVTAVVDGFVNRLRSRSFTTASGGADTFRNLVLVVDEYQLVKDVISESVLTLLREARKFNIRVVLGAHSKNVSSLGFDGQGDIRDGLTILQLTGNGSGQPHTAAVRYGMSRDELVVRHPGDGWSPKLPRLGPITTVSFQVETAIERADGSGTGSGTGTAIAPGNSFGKKMGPEQPRSNPEQPWEQPGATRSNLVVAPGATLGATPEQPGATLGATRSNPEQPWEQPGATLGATRSNLGSNPEQPGATLGATRSNPEQPWEQPGATLGATRSNLGSNPEQPGATGNRYKSVPDEIAELAPGLTVDLLNEIALKLGSGCSTNSIRKMKAVQIRAQNVSAVCRAIKRDLGMSDE